MRLLGACQERYDFHGNQLYGPPFAIQGESNADPCQPDKDRPTWASYNRGSVNMFPVAQAQRGTERDTERERDREREGVEREGGEREGRER